MGSSPRMRGTPFLAVVLESDLGIIPAYAGNTEYRQTTNPPRRDHPRVCGEHVDAIDIARTSLGSSPRMRGTHNATFDMDCTMGIIPAYAGNTVSKPKILSLQWDHPRVCGEHSTSSNPPDVVSGSSPRMRGTRGILSRGSPSHGIIPAYAGNTSLPNVFAILTRDHPRVCGEHGVMSGVRVHTTGSSPRMRGTPLGGFDRMTLRGIIPAYAGNTRH